ncbi:hypothetical protein [Bacillus wiedmannii]|uniref:hypothetical protein n=1 Tax=Bacillus wiedmannii TaxID=1890302 RepID=UPI000BEFB28E|nr:hypothetical protein [Bacillus wiedmannii]PEM08537.1 hypothetical protein CN610_20000 [Bacillus wiedmannii]
MGRMKFEIIEEKKEAAPITFKEGDILHVQFESGREGLYKVAHWSKWNLVPITHTGSLSGEHDTLEELIESVREYKYQSVRVFDAEETKIQLVA